MQIIHRLAAIAAMAFALLSLSANLPAQTTAPAPAPKPLTAGEMAAFLAPYVDNQTVAVAHVDTAMLDPAAIESFVNEMMDVGKLPPKDEARDSIHTARIAADAFLARFKELGGRHVYAALAHPDAWPAMQPLALLFPVEAGGDAKGLAEFLQTTAGPDLKTALLGDHVIFLGQEVPLARLRGLKARPRPELTDGLAAACADASAIQVAATLTPDMRRVIAEMMPRLPDELARAANAGPTGLSTDFVSTGLRYIAFSVVVPPKAALRLDFCFQADADAAITGRLLAAGLRALADLPDFKGAFASEEDRQFLPPVLALLHAAAPRVDGQDVRMSLDAKQTFEAAALLQAGLGQARDAAQRVNSMSRMRQILMAGVVYASDHKGNWPPDLEILVKNAPEVAKLLVNPTDPKLRQYVYRPLTPAENAKLRAAKLADGVVPVLWEQVDDDRTPLNVGYQDGHVQQFPNRKALDDQLAALKKRLEAPPEK